MKLFVTFFAIVILTGIARVESQEVSGHGNTRDPFSLPSGVHLLAKGNVASVSKEAPSKPEVSPVPPKVKAIMISDQVRLALIDRQIVAVGDSINDERILEIKTNHVILGKGDKKRVIHMSQSLSGLILEKKE